MDLDRLALRSGQGERVEASISPGEIELGGHGYRPGPEPSPARLDVSRTVSGYALRLRFEIGVEGPCMRCLGPAALTVSVDAREIDQPGDDEQAVAGPPDGEPGTELQSPYVTEGELDVGRWARDALVLALPDPVVCEEACPGLCQVCGEPLAGADPEAHRHDEGGDPRWAKLRELDLGHEDPGSG